MDSNFGNVGEEIKVCRRLKGLTQKQLGEKCDPPMKDSAIRRIESGRIKPTSETLARIAVALDMHPMRFVGYGFRDTITPTVIDVYDLSDSEVKEMQLFKEFLIYKRLKDGEAEE